MASAQGAATFSVIAKDAASSVLKGVGKEMGRLGKTGGAVFKTLAATAAAVGAALTAAAAASLKLARAAISAAIEDDAEQQKLIATLKARGLNTEEATKRVNELIAAGQKLAFTDSEVRAGYATATQFAKGYAKQQAILAAAQNLARAKNISLEQATKLVGKAFIGSGAALKNYGVDLKRTVTTVEKKIKRDRDGNEVVDRQIKQTKEVIKGLEAVALIDKQFGGVAEAYSKTFAGQFDIVKDSINETVEAIGYAIGGGEGLPTFVRLLEGIRPVLDDVLGEINKNLPDIQRFGRELVEKFLAKLPGYVATAKRELPILIDNIKNFIGGVGGFAKDVASFLGPEGLITAGIAALGGKMGGLGGALGATFAAEFIKLGVDPITATITGTLAGAITAGVVQGFASSAAQAAVSKFLGLFKTVPITPSIPLGGGAVPGALATGGLAAAGIAVSIVAVTAAAAAALSDAITGKGLTNKVGGNNVIDIFGTTAATLANNSKDQGKVLSDLFTFITTGQRPIEVTNDLTVTLDGEVLARNIDRRLGQNLRAGTPRTGGR
jgi:hypothetical protein